MAIAIEPSLFEPAAQPVIAQSQSWIEATLFGNVAIALCMLAVALVGFLALTGRLPIRRGLFVIVGCFVVLGAPVLALGIGSAMQDEAPAPAPPIAEGEREPRGDLLPADYDPYAGASLRRD